jgi:hypothetical protein
MGGLSLPGIGLALVTMYLPLPSYCIGMSCTSRALLVMQLLIRLPVHLRHWQ